jgi:hypothetical protein
MRTHLTHGGDVTRHRTRVAALRGRAALAAVVAGAALQAVAPAAHAAALPAPCPFGSGAEATTRICTLHATTGTLALAGGPTVDTYRFTDGTTGPDIGGPVLVVNAGDRVILRLANDIAGQDVSLNVTQQRLLSDPAGPAPDPTVGLASGAGTQDYVIDSARLGTSLYEAGPTPNGRRQTALGLYGALVVQPDPAGANASSAYGDAASSYDDQQVMVLSEIDPALNAAPGTFDLSEFNPRYWLVNGSQTPPEVAVDPGNATTPTSRVLFRYVNAGLKDRNMAMLGGSQLDVGQDSLEYRNPLGVVVEPVPAGATADAIAIAPTSAGAGTQLPIYDQSIQLGNDGGAMLAYVDVAGSAPASCTAGRQSVGPLTFGAATAYPNNPAAAHDWTATSTSSSIGSPRVRITATAQLCDANPTLSAAEYWIDAPGADGSGSAASVSGTAITVEPGDVRLAALTSGLHTVYVHGQDSGGNWGPLASSTFVIDNTGPDSSKMTLDPAKSNGGVASALTVAASDRNLGDQLVTGGEYFVDAGGPAGSGTPLVLTAPDVNAELTASIDASALAEGVHTIYVRAKDELGNWGPLATTTLAIDRTGPTVSGVTLDPSPNNGHIPWEPNSIYFRAYGTIADPTSNGVSSVVDRGEVWFDQCPPVVDGKPAPSGGIVDPADGQFTSSSEGFVIYIPLSHLNSFANGSTHTLYVRGRDASGNWSADCASGTISIDRTLPDPGTVSVTVDDGAGGAAAAAVRGALRAGASLRTVAQLAAKVNYGTHVTVTTTGHDLQADGAAPHAITRAEWFDGADPGAGRGTPMQAVDGSYDSVREAVRST